MTLFSFWIACTAPMVAAPTDVPAAPAPEPEPEPSGPRTHALAHIDSLPPPDGERYAASHILLPFEGAVGAPADTTDSDADAFERAVELRVRAGTEPFADLAREHSEGPSAPRGGQLGTYRTGTMVPAFERAVASVEVGALGPVVRTPFGWHVIRRDAVEIARVQHLQISWNGALRSDATRSKAEARQLIDSLAAEATAPTFAALADQHSDDTSAGPGGDLGLVTRGQMVPAFEDAVFTARPGEISPVVESPYGYHLIQRTE